MRRIRLILLVVVVSSFMLNTAVWTEARKTRPSTSDIITSEPELSTDRYSYCVGEPVHITITGPTSGGSTDYSMGYVMKDENGDWVRIYYLRLMDERSSEDPQYYTWDQTYYVEEEYDPLGNYNIHYSKNGEQVPTGKYYLYSAISYAGPAEIEIVDCTSEPDPSPTVTTDKYTYCAGETVFITVDPQIPMMFPSVSDEVFINYMIKDVSGEYVKEQPTLDYYGLDAVWFWQYPKTFEWNQSYLVYESHYGSMIYDPPGIPESRPPTGEQVPPGKYYIYASLNGEEISKPVDIEITDCRNKIVITTDKYHYFIGEPISVTVNSDNDGFYTFANQQVIGIKNLNGEYVVNYATQCFPRFATTPYTWTWDQKYIIYEGGGWLGATLVTPPSGEQVPAGRYFAWVEPAYDAVVTPAEFVILEKPKSEVKIEKVKISGPDEVFIHAYNEWELKITVANLGDSCTLENVAVYDVLPAEFELLDYSLTQGTMDATKSGKGKMGSTHLTWYVGHLGSPNAYCGAYQAELVLRIATTKNPAGKQEFTSSGVYALNNGATAKGTIVETNEEVTAGPTETISVIALDPEKYICSKNFRYRNADYLSEDIFYAGHVDCAAGWADFYMASDGELVGIDSFVDEDLLRLYRQRIAEPRKSNSELETELSPVSNDQSVGDDANLSSGIGTIHFIFMSQSSAFGLVAYCYMKRRKGMRPGQVSSQNPYAAPIRTHR